MKYEDFEKAQELRDEIDKLQDIALALMPDEPYEGKKDTPVKLSRVSGDHYSEPVNVPPDLARKLADVVWGLAHEKEKEFEAL